MLGLSLTLPRIDTGPFTFAQRQGMAQTPPFAAWLAQVTPSYHWEWPHLRYIRSALDEVTAGRLSRLMIFCPPQHGKSQMTTIRYPVWRLERNPQLRVIVGCYNQTLANGFSRQARRIARERMALDNERKAVEQWQTAQGGVFRAVGVGAGITGAGGDLILIDDPVKSRDEAESASYRDRVWDWYTNDLFTRQGPSAAMILIMTRWHTDDLAGRILASADGPNWRVINLPALAEENDPLGRAEGAALCPERYDEAALADRRSVLGSYAFTALYQGSPVPSGGGMFKRSAFQSIGGYPPTRWRIRYWDKASSTSAAAKYTAGVRLAITNEGQVIIEHVIRGQWSTGERRKIMRQTAESDAAQFSNGVVIFIEQEPGSSGLDSVQDEIRLLSGFPVFADRPSGDKDTRMLPIVAQAEAGNLYLAQGAWHDEYIDELCSLPNGRYRDQADATSGAFNRLVEIINSQPEGTAIYDQRVSISPY